MAATGGPAEEAETRRFSFLKGDVDAAAPPGNAAFDWDRAAATVRENLTEAMNARHVAFLLGSGCSSYVVEDEDDEEDLIGDAEDDAAGDDEDDDGDEDGDDKRLELGVPTMGPLASDFHDAWADDDQPNRLTKAEHDLLKEKLGFDADGGDCAGNLERLLETLYSFKFILAQTDNKEMLKAKDTVDAVIGKVTRFITGKCSDGEFSSGDDTVLKLYQSFYRKLIYRDRGLPRPWVFTTNYDLFNERAMDRLGIPYCNGFSGTVERRFNPANFRYALAEQLDLANRKWTAVDNFVYFAKLHGSISWVEEKSGLFPIREFQSPPEDGDGRVMIYPTPAKQNASFASPYSDLFREFQHRIVREQSVLFTIGYGFGDEHVNNIIFQALTVPTFRLIALVPPTAGGVVRTLKKLKDPRIWLIGGEGPDEDSRAHYFDVFLEKFMPDAPGDRIDKAVEKVLKAVADAKDAESADGDAGDDR